MSAEKFPLEWPKDYPRTKDQKGSRFRNNSFAKCRDYLFNQLRLMLPYSERNTIVLSTNIPLRQDGIPYANYRQPDDKGVAVYFQYKGDSVVICCDKWDKIEDNMWACAQTIESLRAIERWGVSDFLKRSFTGFNALPPANSAAKPKRDWWVVFKYASRPGRESCDWSGVKAQYRSLAKEKHPDAGGSTEEFQELNTAFKEAEQYFSDNKRPSPGG